MPTPEIRKAENTAKSMRQRQAAQLVTRLIALQAADAAVLPDDVTHVEDNSDLQQQELRNTAGPAESQAAAASSDREPDIDEAPPIPTDVVTDIEVSPPNPTIASFQRVPKQHELQDGQHFFAPCVDPIGDLIYPCSDSNGV